MSKKRRKKKARITNRQAKIRQKKKKPNKQTNTNSKKFNNFTQLENISHFSKIMCSYENNIVLQLIQRPVIMPSTECLT